MSDHESIRRMKCRIIESLGLDPTTVKSLTIRLEPVDPVTVTAEVFVFDDEGELATTLEEYELTPKEQLER